MEKSWSAATFTALGGGTGTTLRSRIGRLNHDGSLDAGFNPGANGDVDVLVVQPDGKILVGGIFTTLGGETRNRIGRLNADGSLDTTFDPGANAIVYAMALQPDGKILVGGSSRRSVAAARNRIGRLDAERRARHRLQSGCERFRLHLLRPAGWPDSRWRRLHDDGRRGLGLTPRNRIARLNADGSLDPSFDPGANDWVLQLVGSRMGGSWSQGVSR